MHPSHWAFALQKDRGCVCFAPGEGTTMSQLIERVKAILMTPRTEWPVIAAEPATVASLYTKYILIVSALGPVGMFLKSTLIGTTTFLGTFRMGVGAGLSMAVAMYVVGLIGIF